MELWSGLLLFRRLGWKELPFAKQPSIQKRISAVRRQLMDYRGFDGLHWPENSRVSGISESGLAPPSALPGLLSLSEKRDLDLVFLRVIALDRENLPIPREFVSVGFDLGTICGEIPPESLIIQEMLLGDEPGFRSLTRDLNENVLFPSQAAAELALRCRKGLQDSGAPLEIDLEDDVISPIEVAVLDRQHVSLPLGG